MSDEETVEDVAEKRWTSKPEDITISVKGFSPPLPALYCEGKVGFIMTMGNVSVFRTSAGLVLVDSASMLHCHHVSETLKESFRDENVNTCIYTHGHIDHVMGIVTIEKEQLERSNTPVKVIAHADVARRFDRYKASLGYNTFINRRQFQIPELNWPDHYRYPDVTYHDSMDVTVGDTVFQLRHGRGETDDATWVYVPQHRVLCTGDFFIWATPNCGNPQKVQRYPLEWAAALRAMDACGAHILLPGHGPPIVGADRVRQALRETAEFLERLCTPVLELINKGTKLDDILARVQLPKELMERPYLQPVYDDPIFIVHTVWHQYAGWFDQNPAHLKPANADELGREIARLAGGKGRLLSRIRELLKDGRLSVAAQLIEFASSAFPDDVEMNTLKAEVYDEMMSGETCLMAQSIYLDAADKAREKAERISKM